MPVWKKPTIKEGILKTTQKHKEERSKEEKKQPKPQENQALTEAALAQLENKDPNYVSEFVQQNLGDKKAESLTQVKSRCDCGRSSRPTERPGWAPPERVLGP